ncbi:MAG TPA: hypothetical protein VIQ51_01590, partial [Chryseosolibacter sp.]
HPRKITDSPGQPNRAAAAASLGTAALEIQHVLQRALTLQRFWNPRKLSRFQLEKIRKYLENFPIRIGNFTPFSHPNMVVQSLT